MLLIFLFIPISYGFVAGETSSLKQNVCLSKGCIATAHRISSTMNKTVDPCDNFYAYACGNFENFMRNATNRNLSSWIVASQMELKRKLAEILSSDITESEPEALKKAKMFYRSCIDTEQETLHYMLKEKSQFEIILYAKWKKYKQQRGHNDTSAPPVVNFVNSDIDCEETKGHTMNSRGMIPLRKVLRKMGISPSLYLTGEENSFDWLSTAVKYKKYFNKDFLFCVNVRPEPDNPDLNYISIEKPIEEEAEFPKIVSKKNRQKQNFMKKRRILFGEVTPISRPATFIQQVARIIDDESGIENATNYAEYLQLKTSLLIYIQKQNLHVMDKNHGSGLSPKIISLQELQDFTDTVPSMIKGRSNQDSSRRLNWNRYFKLLFEDVENIDWENRKKTLKIMVYDKDYLYDIISFIKEYSTHFESILWFNIIQLLLFYTTDELRKIAFKFINEDMSTMPMERLCRELAMESMDMAVAYPLINGNAKDHKNEVAEMTDNLKYVLGKIVEKSSWLDDETKNATYNKITKMRSYVSHPYWLSNSTALDAYYQQFKVKDGDFIQSVMNINEVIVKMNLETLERPIYEQDFCGTNILEMNAFYYPRDNAMCIPTGIIQFPFYGHPIQVINYGTLGTIVGHEITHGFDDETKIFTHKNLNRSDSDPLLKEYFNREKCFIDAYNDIEVGLIRLSVNGVRTLKENIADHGGLEEAYMAYQLYTQKNGQEPLLPGFENFTHKQMFTLAFANLWCEKTTLYDLFKQLLSDEHSPNEARVVGSLRNFKPFSEIWHCPVGSGMNPPKKCDLF